MLLSLNHFFYYFIRPRVFWLCASVLQCKCMSLSGRGRRISVCVLFLCAGACAVQVAARRLCVRAHLPAKLSGSAPSPFPCLPLAVFTPLYLLSSEGSLLPALPKDLFTPRLTDSCLTLHCSPQIMAKYKEGKEKKKPAVLPPRKKKSLCQRRRGEALVVHRDPRRGAECPCSATPDSATPTAFRLASLRALLFSWRGNNARMQNCM